MSLLSPSFLLLYCFFFFFSSRRRHTRLQGDWSSDVCSSDLLSPPREIPRRAALVVVALALIASVVAGREELSSDPQAAPEPAPAPAVNGATPQASLPDLDLDKLNRSVRSNRITDLFTSKAAA